MADTKFREDEGAAAEGAEIVRGAEACYRYLVHLLEELGFPRALLPLRELEECGWVRATGFLWMRQRAPYEHFFPGTGTRVIYGTEVTAYAESRRMKRMTGTKGKQMLIWVRIVEMNLVEHAEGGPRIYFRTPVGLGKSFPVTVFTVEDDKHKYIMEEEKENEVLMK